MSSTPNKSPTFHRKAVWGAFWNILTSWGSRIISLVGTLVLTRFVTADAYGAAIGSAAVVVFSVNQFSTTGVGQYLITNPNDGEDVPFHSTFIHLVLGVLSLGLIVPLTYFILSPSVAAVWPKLAEATVTIAPYLPGLTLAAALDRIGFIPERLMVSDMSFKRIGIVRTLSELLFTISTLVFAILGWQGMSFVAGNIVRSVFRNAIFIASIRPSRWLKPYPLSRKRTYELMNYGWPYTIMSIAQFASRRWDNLLIKWFQGDAAAGYYNLAYNLADVPAVQIGEQIGDVLLPSFARMNNEQKKIAFVQSTTLLVLIISPLAVGLGVVAPTLIGTLFNDKWQTVGPMLLALSSLSVVRPIAWVVSIYLQARSHMKGVMVIEILKVIGLMGAITTIGRNDPLWACYAVGIAFSVHALACLFLIVRLDQIPFKKLVAPLLPPILCCLPMAAAVVATRYIPIEMPSVVRLFMEILIGAVVYIPSAFLLAPTASRDLIQIVRGARTRKMDDPITEDA